MSPRSPDGSLPQCLLSRVPHRSFFWVGIPSGTKLWSLLKWFPMLSTPWWELLPRGLFLAMASGSPSRFHGHTSFAWWPLYGQTSSGRDTGGEVCQVSTWGFCLEINLHPVFSLLRLRCLSLSPIVLQQWSSPLCDYRLSQIVHDT